MKRSKKRSGPVKGAKAKKEALWSRNFRSVEFVLFVKGLKCVGCGEHSINIQVHHDPTRGSGGTWEDTSPLCMECHSRRHSKGVLTFWAEVGKSYQQSNAETHAKWLGVASVAPLG